MTDPERQQLDERAQKVSAVWPTLREALGCLDCGYLIRHVIGGTCPICGSRGEMLNVAEFFNEAKLKEKRERGSEEADQFSSAESQERLTGSVPQPETTKGETAD